MLSYFLLKLKYFVVLLKQTIDFYTPFGMNNKFFSIILLFYLDFNFILTRFAKSGSHSFFIGYVLMCSP